jgi:hypothetical protein
MNNLDRIYYIFTQSNKFPSFDNHINQRSKNMNNWDRIYCIYTQSNLSYLGEVGAAVLMIHIEYGKNEVWNLYHNISIGFCTRIGSAFLFLWS